MIGKDEATQLVESLACPDYRRTHTLSEGRNMYTIRKGKINYCGTDVIAIVDTKGKVVARHTNPDTARKDRDRLNGVKGWWK